MRPQPGIFALGDPEHCFVELDLRGEGSDPPGEGSGPWGGGSARPGAGSDPPGEAPGAWATGPGSAPPVGAAGLVSALASLSGPATTIAGVNFVAGFRPELWRSVAPGGSSGAGLARSFETIAGPEMAMPATQHDAWFWISGGSRDVVFDNTIRVLDAVAPMATVASELGGWLYEHTRDLTGFIDGTENPSMIEAASVAAGADGSSVLLYQKWQHLASWRSLSVEQQELVIGRTKADSVELPEDVMPQDSHVSRTVVEEGGEELAIYRRNVAYGGPSDHGTVFVGFCATQHPLEIMLRRMAGAEDGIRDALTRYSTPLSGAFYVVPSVEALARFADSE